jgi:pyruvate/2-oxoglutarate/acetoin dehydrogenase E1 component
LFKSAVQDPDLVAFLEEMSCYGWSGEVPEGEYYTPFNPIVRREGRDITLITWGPRMLKLATDAADILLKESISLEVIDLRVLNPLDTEFLFEHIKETGRVIILHEDSKFMGFGAEISAAIAENTAFYSLQGRIVRVAAMNTPIPTNLVLENYRLPNVQKLISAARKVMEES